MSHPWHHAESSARKFGGEPVDYLAIHDWFDATKAHCALFTHRALRHHAFGIFEAEERFGAVLTNSAGRIVPTRFIGEQHVKEDCGGRIPSAADWLGQISPAAWMGPGSLHHDAPVEMTDPVEDWRSEVASGGTVLGLQEWMKRQASMAV